MKFYGYSMVYDGKKVGEMISASEWLEKIPFIISAGIRRTLGEEPGLLVAERAGF